MLVNSLCIFFKEVDYYCSTQRLERRYSNIGLFLKWRHHNNNDHSKPWSIVGVILSQYILWQKEVQILEQIIEMVKPPVDELRDELEKGCCKTHYRYDQSIYLKIPLVFRFPLFGLVTTDSMRVYSWFPCNQLKHHLFICRNY